MGCSRTTVIRSRRDDAAFCRFRAAHGVRSPPSAGLALPHGEAVWKEQHPYCRRRGCVPVGQVVGQEAGGHQAPTGRVHSEQRGQLRYPAVGRGRPPAAPSEPATFGSHAGRGFHGGGQAGGQRTHRAGSVGDSVVARTPQPRTARREGGRTQSAARPRVLAPTLPRPRLHPARGPRRHHQPAPAPPGRRECFSEPQDGLTPTHQHGVVVTERNEGLPGKGSLPGALRSAGSRSTATGRR